MKLLPAHALCWSSLLVLFWFSQSESSNVDDCEDTYSTTLEPVHPLHENETVSIGKCDISCFLYPTNILNCSWSLYTLDKDAQLSVSISVYDNIIRPMRFVSEDRVGSKSTVLPDFNDLYVILSFNVSLHNKYTSYCIRYDTDILEVLLPPSNLSASVKDGNLLVTWLPPRSRQGHRRTCFEYQMDMGDQKKLKHFDSKESYTTNADPTITYRVRIRTRINGYCSGSTQWSDWSHVVTVEQSVFKLNTLVIVSISLGIPMILLAVLLLVRHQRVSKVLFPQIPRPPPKYKCFLEKNETFNVSMSSYCTHPPTHIYSHPAPLTQP
ncbi:hypothetical protein PAMP_004490 [Pampus punctatissimus]